MGAVGGGKSSHSHPGAEIGAFGGAAPRTPQTPPFPPWGQLQEGVGAVGGFWGDPGGCGGILWDQVPPGALKLGCSGREHPGPPQTSPEPTWGGLREGLSGDLGGGSWSFWGVPRVWGQFGGSCPPRPTWGGEGGGRGGGEAPPLGQECVVGARPPPRRQHRVGQEVRPCREGEFTHGGWEGLRGSRGGHRWSGRGSGHPKSVLEGSEWSLGGPMGVPGGLRGRGWRVSGGLRWIWGIPGGLGRGLGWSLGRALRV